MPKRTPDDAIARPRIAADAPLFDQTTSAPFARNIPQAPAPDCAVLQYASGLTRARPEGTGAFQSYTGFHAQIGRDAALDVACTTNHMPRGQIRHMGGSVVDDWLFGELVRIYPLTAGPPATTISACRSPRFRQATADAGIGLAWPDGGKSRMAGRGYLELGHALVMLQLSVTSTMTSYLLAALLDHTRICEAADALVQANGRRIDRVLPYELALLLRVGDPQVVGSSQTQEICPLVSAHPAHPTTDYLRSLWRPAALAQDALTNWPAVQIWAQGYGVGETNGDSHLREES